MRKIACQYKHPIILNYKDELNNIRLALGLSKNKFKKLFSSALRLGIITIEGNNLRLPSKTKETTDFKQSKKNDFRRTHKPLDFTYLVLIQSHYYKQVSEIKRKADQPDLIIQNSGRTDRLSKIDSNVRNYAITASCRAVSKLLMLNSTSKAKRVLDDLNKRGLISIEKHIEPISQTRAYDLMRNGFRHAVRFNRKEQEYYEVFASTFKLNYTLKRTTPSKWDLMTAHQRHIAIEMGYSKEYYSKAS